MAESTFSNGLKIVHGTETLNDISAAGTKYAEVSFGGIFTEVPTISVSLDADGTLGTAAPAFRYLTKNSVRIYAKNSSSSSSITGVKVYWVAIGY